MKKSIALLMILLILVSTLSITAYAPQITEGTVNEFLNENFSETSKTNDVPPTYNVDKFDRATKDLSEGDAGGAVQQDKTSEGSQQTSQHFEDKWNFNGTNGWSDFAYVDGNITRLVVGVNYEKLTSHIQLEKLAAKYQAKIVNTVSIGNEIRAVVVEIPSVSTTAFVEETRANGLASYIEPSMKAQIQFVPNDPYWSTQWGPQRIEAEWAWNTTLGDPSVLVAVVDTGIYYTHPDLAANYVPLGYDWVNNDNDPLDDHGHGTHVSGTIAAVISNGVGIAGLAQVRIMAEKVLDSGGGGYWDWIANGIIHAVDQGADIISMSLGGYGESELLHDAVRYAYDSGVLIVAAAGNENTNIKLYPAGYDEVVAVAATDQWDNKAWFSNWGDWIELAAPGVAIYSTVPWGYTYASGTSMATPHVSGVAALAWSHFPNKTRDWLRLWLRYTADDLGDSGFDVYYGYGRINARKAVEESPPDHELIAYEWKTPPYVEPAGLATINATILNFGENNETDVAVQLLANGTMIDNVSIGFLASGGTATVSLTWNPMVEGLYNVTLYVVPVAGETSVENNVLWKYIYVGVPVKAVVLHSVGNIYGRIITNWQVLNTEWHRFGDTMVYIDYTTLNKAIITYEDIAATEADTLIISCAYDPRMGWQFTDSEIEAIRRYVLEGHGLIATAGTLYNWVPNNNKLAPLFGLNETIVWGVTGTDLLHLVNRTHPIFTNVPDPLVFPQVGTALPYDGRWDSNELVSGKYLALGHYQESAIVTYRGLVYLSPWLEVIPPYYHHHLQLLYNAITWSQYQKPEHELEVSIKCPSHLKPNESALVNATVQNMGLNDETNVELFLLLDGAQVANLTVPTLAIGELATLSYLWTPTMGTYNVTAYAPPVPGETDTFNNVKTILSRVSYAKVIGFIETHGESLHSDSLKIFYQSLGHIVTTIYSTLTPELLVDYDILIVGEDWSNYPWLPSEIATVQDFISSGKGFVGIGDELAYPVQTILGEYGITYTGSYGNPGSSSNFDHSHPLMTDVNYIYASYPVNSLQAVPPGYWIANDAYNVHMLIAGAEVGGYVLFMSDDFAAYVYDDDNEIMFTNMVEWMAVKYEHDIAVSLVVPASIELGNTTMINATVRNIGLNNETGVELYLLIIGSVVSYATIPQLHVGELYTINYLWTPTKTGTYNITAYTPPVIGEEYIANNFVTKKVAVWFYMRLYLPSEWVGGGVPMGWHADDASWSYTLPFDFPFYGINYRTIYVSSNGLITFIGPDSSWGNGIPELARKLAIAAAWDDWMTNQRPGDDIYIGQPDPDHVVIRWQVVAFYDRGIEANFEALLGSNGVIQLNYAYNNGPVSATVGISNSVGHILAEDVTNLNYINTTVFAPFSLDHELAVTLQAPVLQEIDTSVLLNATVFNRGLNNETDVELQLFINGTVADSVLIPELSSGASYRLSYLWTPTVEGIYNITAYAPSVPKEEFTANNIATKLVKARPIKGYILFDQTHGTDSIAYYNLWVTNLTNRGYIIETHTSGPLTSTILKMYEVLVIPQAHYDYSSDELSTIQNFVLNGGGLLVIGDDNPWIYTSLTNFSGISWTGGGYGGYTSDITPHPVTVGVTTTFFSAPVSDLHVDYVFAVDIIRDQYGYIMLAVSEIVAGKVLGIADEQSIDDSNIGYADNLRLANNMIDWMSTLYEHDVAIVSVAPSTSEALVGDTIDISVVAENQGDFTESFAVSVYTQSLNSTRIYFDPSSYMFDPAYVTIGYRFNVTLWVEDVADLCAWQVRVDYNDSIINVTRWFEPTWDPAYVFYGKATIPLPRPPKVYYSHLDPDKGSANVASVLFPWPPPGGGITGTGLLFILEFEVTAIPPAGETLSTNLTIDNEGTSLLNWDAEVIPDVHRENGYYAVGPGGPLPPPRYYRIGTIIVTELAPGENITLLFRWNTIGVWPSDYMIWAEASMVPGDIDTADNKYVDGIIRIVKPPFASFTYSPTFPKPGEIVTFNATSSTPNGGAIISYNWDFGDGNVTTTTDPIIIHTYTFSGLYNVTLTITDSEGLTDSAWKTIYLFIRDIAVINVTPSTDRAYMGRTISINVTMLNEGEVTETFDVILYWNTTAGDVIGTQGVTDLLPGETRTLTFLWNTTNVTPCQNYTITAYATPVLGETDIADNTLSSSTLVKVKLLGDINGDGKIDIKDIATVALAFGSYPSHPRWNPEADLNYDGKVDIKDIAIVARNFGKTYP